MGLQVILVWRLPRKAKFLLGPRVSGAGEATGTLSTRPSTTTLGICTPVLDDVFFQVVLQGTISRCYPLGYNRGDWQSPSKPVSLSIPDTQILSPQASTQLIRHSKFYCQSWPRVSRALSDLTRKVRSSAQIVGFGQNLAHRARQHVLPN